MALSLRLGGWAALALCFAAPSLRAQRADTTPEQAYQIQRSTLQKQLQDDRQQLSALHGERMRLEAQIDEALARATQQRTRALLMSDDQRALVQLDSVLAAAQHDMQEQRARMVALGQSVRTRSGAVLVVLFRADSSVIGSLGPVSLHVDDAPPTSRSYDALGAAALGHGAVDQLFRGAVLPTSHVIELDVTLGGQPVVQRVRLDAPGNRVTYVQFTAGAGRVLSTQWTSDRASAF